jgi:hypothetical protein
MTAFQDQAEAAIRDASDLVEGTWAARDQCPAGFAELFRRWEDSAPSTHQPCEHITSPQPVHWYAMDPGRVLCGDCAAREEARLYAGPRVCLACHQPLRPYRRSEKRAAIAVGNAVLHGPLCRACQS